MKVLYIGRGDNQDIQFDDGMISRQHAVLRIHSTGKMEIISKGQNGTSVNANPIKQDVPYPVTRKDVVTFAGSQTLDWKKIPDPRKTIVAVLAAVVLIAAVVAVLVNLPSKERNILPPTQTSGKTASPSEKKDSLENRDAEYVSPFAPKVEEAPKPEAGKTKGSKKKAAEVKPEDKPAEAKPETKQPEEEIVDPIIL